MVRAGRSRCGLRAPMALYAFGGGGSGAATRLSGTVKRNAETICPLSGTAVDGSFARMATSDPHEIIATQQGIAVDLQGLGCLLV
jgi:hypothetical protein